MSDDLVTRLLALADSLHGAMPKEAKDIAQAIIREAADALEWQSAITKGLQERCDKQAPDQVELRQLVDDLRKQLRQAEAHIEHADSEIKALRAKLTEAVGNRIAYRDCYHDKCAQVDNLSRRLAEVKGHCNENADETCRQIVRAEKAEAEAAAAEERHQKARQAWHLESLELRKGIRTATAEAAALRKAATMLMNGFGSSLGEAFGADEMRQALSQPGPGAALLERARKLEGVAEAARAWATECRDDIGHDKLNLTWLIQALAALDE